jgi:predicted nucleic acid-binding protein
MKALVFDTGPIINLALNNMLWLAPKLKALYAGDFYITQSVFREAIERPLTSKKYKFEALQILKLKEQGVIKVYKNPKLARETTSYHTLANRIFKAKNSFVKNFHFADIESIVLGKTLQADAVVIDEFYTRMLMENPEALRERMEKKLHEPVTIVDANLKEFKRRIGEIRIIRSFELVALSYEKGLFDEYVLSIGNPRKTLLEGVLWAIKLNGCSVTEQEINELIEIEEKIITKGR